MALKSQTPIHNFWGTFANAPALPNASGNALSPLVLEAGDVAYVGTPADTLYVCTSPGTAGGGNAVWVALATGTGTPVAIASERWVTTGGNDLTGDGSLSAPYATVGAALASITTASPTSRWAVRVAAGAFTEAAPLLLKPNVYIIGEDRNATRLTAPSVALDATFSAGGGVDNRAGFANLTLIGAATFDFAAVTSSAGKLYANGVNFNSAVAFNGYSAINQTIFFDCYFFGTFTTSGVNHGAHVSCVHSALAINQHPSLPSILNAIGGTSGAATFTTTVNDFARRVSVFAKNFWMEPVTIDGPSTYLDTTVSSLPSAGPTIANGANLVWLDQGANRKLSNLQGPTSVNESLVPDLDSSRYLGDFGKQWLFTFNYVLTSTGTDLYIITTPSTFGSSAVGHAIYIQPDSYGLDAGTNGGNVEIETVPATGGGNSGSVVLKTGTAASPGVRGDLTIDVNEVNLALIGALNVNAVPGTAGQVLTSQGALLPPVWGAGGGGGLGSKVLLVVEGGSYATVQAAINAALDTDVILVGPKALGGSWGPAVFPAQKRLALVGIAPKVSEYPKVDSVTYSPTTGLNINENTVYVRGLFINGDYAASPAVTFSGTALARLRVQECFIFNSGTSGTVVSLNNSASSGGTQSTTYLDNCTIQSAAVLGTMVSHLSGYTVIKNNTIIEGGLNALTTAAGLIEVFDTQLQSNVAANAVIRVNGGLVSITSSRVVNDNAAGIGAFINAAAPANYFGANNSVFLVGGASPGAGARCVTGVSAAALYVYGQVVYGTPITAANTVTVVTASSVLQEAATGDLSGNYPAPTVARLQGRAVSATAPSASQVLTWNGTAWAPATPAGGGVTSVTATAPINSTGGATPNLSLTGAVGVANGGTGLTTTPANGQIPLGNGSGYTLGTLTAGAGITVTNASGSVTVASNANGPQSIVLNATATGGTATVIGTIYVPAARTLTASSLAYIGGSLVGDTTVLTLNPAGGGAAVATWTRVNQLGSQAVTGTPTITPAGWYDLTLQGTAGSGIAFARGLYLA